MLYGTQTRCRELSQRNFMLVPFDIPFNGPATTFLHQDSNFLPRYAIIEAGAHCLAVVELHAVNRETFFHPAVEAHYEVERKFIFLEVLNAGLAATVVQARVQPISVERREMFLVAEFRYTQGHPRNVVNFGAKSVDVGSHAEDSL